VVQRIQPTLSLGWAGLPATGHDWYDPRLPSSTDFSLRTPFFV
jgi:hypothetical protein